MTVKYTSTSELPEPKGNHSGVNLNTGLDLSDFFIVSPDCIEEVNNKIQTIQQKLGDSSPAQLEVRIDFDGTMTQRQPGTWRALHYGLTAEKREASRLERAQNLALQKKGELSLDALRRWTQSEARRHTEDGTHEDIMIGEAKRIKELRAGTLELFNFCYKQSIPVRIVTAGVANIIKYVAAREGLKVSDDNIIGNTLHLNDSGNTTHWDEENAVDSLNKCERVERKFPRIKGHGRCIIVIGDSLYDSKMALDHSEDTILRIRTAQEDGNTPEYIEESFLKDPEVNHSYYDLIVRDISFAAITNLLKFLTAQRSSSNSE